MKIAFFSESTTDEAILKIFVEGILGEEVESIDLPNTITQRSSSGVDRYLPNVLRGVYYWTNAEALVVVSDSDDTPVHVEEHERQENLKCRLCQLRKTVSETLSKIKGEKIFRVAIGVPVPAIEAWYLYGKNPQVYELTWLRKQNGEKITYHRIKLKEEVYVSTRTPLEKKITFAEKEAKRIVENGLLGDLERAFPYGFGSLVNEIRSWKS